MIQIYGARPFRRAITKTVEDKLSEEILKKEVLKKGIKVLVSVDKEQLIFNRIYFQWQKAISNIYYRDSFYFYA